MRRIPAAVTVLALAGFLCPSASAQQLPSDPGKIKAALVQHDAQGAECRRQFDAKRLKTATALANCADRGLIELLTAAGYPYMDLIHVLVTEHLAIAERVDRKKITLTEGWAQSAEPMSRIAGEVRSRNLAAQNAAAALAQQRAAAEAQARAQAQADAQAEALEQMQAQAAADADAARRAQLLDAAARLLAPQYVAPARPYPSQTICQRLGSQLICNSHKVHRRLRCEADQAPVSNNFRSVASSGYTFGP